MRYKEKIEQEISDLEDQIIELKTQLETPPFLIGKLYRRKNNDNCIYTFIDWNGTVRLLNITNSHMWKTSCDRIVKSYQYRGVLQKAKIFPNCSAVRAFSKIVNELYLINE